MEAVRAWYDGPQQIDPEALAAFGLQVEGNTPEAFGVYPDNWAPLQVFMDMATQWNVVQGGYIGLRYEVLPVVLRCHRVPREAWPDAFQALRTMEMEALKRLNKRR